MSITYTIPSEFQDQLSITEPLDSRSDTKILASLEQFKPVTSEKNIWAFWHSGIKGLPEWCKRNVVDWFRIQGPSWSIRVLDSDPSSPNFFLKYVSADLFPTSIATGKMTGQFVGQHTADFVRSGVIYQHGGVFMDTGCLLVRRLDRFCWDQLMDDQNPYRIGTAGWYTGNISNHFVAARKEDPFIKRWHDLMLHLWQNRSDHSGTVIGNPLFNDLLARGGKSGKPALDALGWDFADMMTTMEYVGQIFAWERLCISDKEDDEGFNSAKYYAEHVLLWEAVPEHWPAEVHVHRKGPHPRIMELLAVRTDANPDSDDYKAAYDLTWTILTTSCMQKVTSVRGLSVTPHLGVLWTMPENIGKDCAKGTFAELLRYGSVHFEQKRTSIRYMKAEIPEHVLKKGILEP